MSRRVLRLMQMREQTGGEGTNELLIDVGSIEAGRVEEGDAELQRPVQARLRVLLAGRIRLGCIEPLTDELRRR